MCVGHPLFCVMPRPPSFPCFVLLPLRPLLLPSLRLCSASPPFLSLPPPISELLRKWRQSNVPRAGNTTVGTHCQMSVDGDNCPPTMKATSACKDPAQQ